MTKYYALFILCFFLGLTSLAAGPQDWKKAFKDAKNFESFELDILAASTKSSAYPARRRTKRR